MVVKAFPQEPGVSPGGGAFIAQFVYRGAGQTKPLATFRPVPGSVS